MPDAPEAGEGQPVDPPGSRRDAAARRSPMTGEGVTAIESQLRAMRTDAEQHIAHARAEFGQANERLKQRTGRDLIVATIIGVGIGAVLIASLIFVKWLFVFFAGAAMVLGVLEFSRALQVAGRRVDVVPQLLTGSLVLLSGFFLQPWVHWIAALSAVVVVVVWRVIAQMAASDGRARIDVIGDCLLYTSPSPRD